MSAGTLAAFRRAEAALGAAVARDAKFLERLTAAGLELDGGAPPGADCEGVIVARVGRVRKHPRADKLKLCEVGAGKRKWKVVCGAGNVKEGLLVPFAPPGARVGKLDIAQRDIRGEASQGMICAADELGLTAKSGGILPLPKTAAAGRDFNDWLRGPLPAVADFDLTPNRGDCLSRLGLLREIAALSGKAPPTAPRVPAKEIVKVAAQARSPVKVSIEDKKDCSHYLGRVVEGLSPAETPAEILAVLAREGMKSVHLAVDICNYVMLELGQPLHAFDLNKLNGDIRVRRAKKGEKLALLNGDTAACVREDLLIADAKGPVALAGVMGGASTEVDEGTTDVFLEAAWFSPPVINGRARAHALSSDAAHRFERGVDPAITRLALDYATALLCRHAGGRAREVVSAGKADAKRAAITLDRERIAKVVGQDIPAAEKILQRLGMRVAKGSGKGGWKVTPPSWRFDINCQADLIEEVVRVHGYDKVKLRPPRVDGAFTARARHRPPADSVRERMAALGYSEVITYSFIGEDWARHFGDPGPRLANPVRADMDTLRTALTPALVSTLQNGRNRGFEDLRLFEIGACFAQKGKKVAQETRLGAIIGNMTETADFYDVKSDLESLSRLGGNRWELRPAAGHPYLHPRQAAEVLAAGKPIGHIGMLSPHLVKTLELESPVAVMEVLLSAVCDGRAPQIKKFSRQPPLKRDISILVKKNIPVGEIMDTIFRHAKTKLPPGSELERLELFDVYQAGELDKKGLKSLAFHLVFRHRERAFSDREGDVIMGAIIQGVTQTHSAELRDGHE